MNTSRLHWSLLVCCLVASVYSTNRYSQCVGWCDVYKGAIHCSLFTVLLTPTRYIGLAVLLAAELPTYG